MSTSTGAEVNSRSSFSFLLSSSEESESEDVDNTDGRWLRFLEIDFGVDRVEVMEIGGGGGLVGWLRDSLLIIAFEATR